ncbi:hypothetical protein WN48_07699 [Eufriesea mexicana]|uniref:Uncharacterized protein n=1 Tax=Eufriesea mexicana TaxID=516756 RepID=A0A310SNH5_9HYME|nr:hypothetical protein WN48_07699 [Eufriesea mexicana]
MLHDPQDASLVLLLARADSTLARLYWDRECDATVLLGVERRLKLDITMITCDAIDARESGSGGGGLEAEGLENAVRRLGVRRKSEQRFGYTNRGIDEPITKGESVIRGDFPREQTNCKPTPRIHGESRNLTVDSVKRKDTSRSDEEHRASAPRCQAKGALLTDNLPIRSRVDRAEESRSMLRMVTRDVAIISVPSEREKWICETDGADREGIVGENDESNYTVTNARDTANACARWMKAKANRSSESIAWIARLY